MWITLFLLMPESNYFVISNRIPSVLYHFWNYYWVYTFFSKNSVYICITALCFKIAMSYSGYFMTIYVFISSDLNELFKGNLDSRFERQFDR